MMKLKELKVYPVREAFERIGVKSSKGYELIAAGLLDARKVGARTVVTADSVAAYIRSLPLFVSKARIDPPRASPDRPGVAPPPAQTRKALSAVDKARARSRHHKPLAL
jgi:hypothetical protein